MDIFKTRFISNNWLTRLLIIVPPDFQLYTTLHRHHHYYHSPRVEFNFRNDEIPPRIEHFIVTVAAVFIKLFPFCYLLACCLHRFQVPLCKNTTLATPAKQFTPQTRTGRWRPLEIISRCFATTQLLLLTITTSKCSTHWVGKYEDDKINVYATLKAQQKVAI